MPHLSIKGRSAATVVVLPILLLVCGGLAACGSSSSNTSTQAAANAASTSAVASSATTPGSTQATPPTPGTPPAGTTGPTGPSGPSGPVAGRFAAVRECLQKNGVTLPQRPGGARPGAGGFLGGGGPHTQTPPKGMTAAQYQAVLKKCGANFRGPRAGAFGARHSFSSPTFRTALVKFGACLRENGVDLPAPNTSGKGPVFDTKGVDTASPKFKEAERKCRSVLLAGLRSRAAGAPSS
jgi:hypothetical protein